MAVTAQAQTRSRPSMTVQVTDALGNPVEGVHVRAYGSADRNGTTDAEGMLVLRNIPAGPMRLRFEREGFVPLERDVVNPQSGRALRVEVTLTAASPEKVRDLDDPPRPTAPPIRPEQLQPRIVSIPDFIEKNFVGRAPRKDSILGCAAAATTTLFQLREPLADHTHASADEILYVVAGEGTLRVAGRDQPLSAGLYALVPRGVAHAVTRRGSNPVVLLSVTAGEPCQTM
jgi:quercetin dioxygenase-like cupin family protein